MIGVANYFDCEKGVKKCSDCFEIKCLSKFHKRTINGEHDETKGQYYNSKCRPCVNLNNYNRRIEKLLESDPKHYWECPECDNYTHKLKNKCRFCKTKKE